MKNYILTLFTVLLLFSCNNSKSNEHATDVIELEETSELENNLDNLQRFQNVLEQQPKYNSYLKMVNMAYMFPEFNDLNEVTVFAPSEANIYGLLNNEFSGLSPDELIKKWKDVVMYHIVDGEIDADALIALIESSETGVYRLKTKQGAFLSFRLTDGHIYVSDENANAYKIILADIEASNGVIHDIEHTLLPQ